MLDMNSHKEIIILRFERYGESKSNIRGHRLYKYKASIIGKYDLLSANLQDAKTEGNYYIN